MSLWTSMNTAVSGLNAAQSAINLASRNVANANTVGYVKKTAQFTALPYGGVSAPVISRQVSQTLINQSRQENNKLASSSVASRFLSSVAAFLGTPATGAGTDGGRLNVRLQDLNDKMQNLATTPTLSTSQTMVGSSAAALAQEIRDTSNYIQTIRQQADFEIGQSIGEINRILENIDKLNRDISRSIALGQDNAAVDMMDTRDTEIGKLSEYFSVKTYDGAAPGSVVVMMENGPVLIDATVRYFDEYNSAGTVSAGMQWNTTNSAFDRISLADSSSLDMTSQLKNGALGALIATRDGTMPQYQAQMDTLAAQLRDGLNEAHNQGVSLPPQGVLTGSHKFGGAAATTAINITGNIQIALVDAAGNATMLTTAIPTGATTIGNVVTAINTALSTGGYNGSATYGANGEIIITPPTAPSDFSVTFVETDGAGNQVPATVQNLANDDPAVNGLSNFLGLNDFYVSNSASGRTYQTASVSSLSQVVTNVSFTLKDINDPVGGGAGTTLGPFNGSLQQIVDQINGALPAGSAARASVYRSGDSYSIQIEGSATLSVTGSMNVSRYDLAASEQLTLNDRLAQDSSQINKGMLFSDGRIPPSYSLNSGDGTIAQRMADVFTQTYNFPRSSGTGGTMTIKTYLAQVVGDISSRSASAVQATVNQGSIASAVNEKLAAYSGVDLDQELTNLIVLQNAYGASARVISSINQMLDTLFDIVR